MGIANPRNVGAHIKEIVGLIPQAISATQAANTAGVTPAYDRLGDANGVPQSMTVHLNCGQTSSNPSAATLQAEVWDSDDGTTFAKYVPPPIAGVVQTGAATAAADCHAAPAAVELDVDLSGARRYVALKIIAAFTGGTSPAIIAGATMTMGGYPVEPA